MKSLFSLTGIALSLLILAACNTKSPAKYSGTPYQDQVYNKGAQTIPGKLQCEYYDLGGEGIAFHDSDSVNSASMKQSTSLIPSFRIRPLTTHNLTL